MAGRPDLPVTAWQPEAVAGHRGRPTLLSNAETWAQVGHLLHAGEAGYRRLGTAREPGTTLAHPRTAGPAPGRPGGGVRRAAARRPRRAGPRPAGPDRRVPRHVGTWPTLASLRLSVDGLRSLGTPLGAGVVFTPGACECPVRLTSRIVDYLAGQSAGRCGPCLNGLPALAAAVRGRRGRRRRHWRHAAG